MAQQGGESAWVSIDTSALVEAIERLNAPAALTDLRLLAIYETRQVWKQAVSGVLLPGMAKVLTDPEYAAALDDDGVVADSGSLVTISPARVYPKAAKIEDGSPAYDMKPKLLRAATKVSAAGFRYLDIPFKHGTPPGKLGAKRKGAGYATTMPERIYRMAKLVEDEARFNGPGLPPPVTKPQLSSMSAPYTHKTSLYGSLKKQRIDRRRSAYITWRRLSEQSARLNPDSWHSPGRAPNHIADAVSAEMERRFPALIEAFLTEYLKGA